MKNLTLQTSTNSYKAAFSSPNSRVFELNGQNVPFIRFHMQSGILCVLLNPTQLIPETTTTGKPKLLKIDGFKSISSLMNFLSEEKKYTGLSVDSGLGFRMKDTKQNWALVKRYGTDAIEHTN